MSQLEQAYIAAHFEALTLANRVREMIEDFPPPDADINRGHVGDLHQIIAQLRAMLGDGD